MNLVKAYNNFFQKYFPSPFSLAILLTLLSFVLVFSFGQYENKAQVFNFWYEGIFTSSLLNFMVYMMFILVFGHIIALSKPSELLINFILRYCKDTGSSVVVVSLFSMLMSLFNWGFGLVFGAILAYKVGQKFKKEHKPLNYPLVGAAAYVGMMVWHGGLSGSAPLAVASANHTFVDKLGIIPVNETLFSSMNIVATLILLIVIPMGFFWLAKKSSESELVTLKTNHLKVEISKATMADRLEGRYFLNGILGFLALSVFFYLAFEALISGKSILNILDLKNTSLLLLGLSLMLHKNVHFFIAAVDESISDLSGILIQFPLYFGIIGLITGSGLSAIIANVFAQISSPQSLPIFTYISAAILNIFIPSGGGQWQVQAPIIIDSAKQSGVSIPKMIMAMCYGDQLTNMLQPFWALPLLGITQLKAKEILPYCLFAFGMGSLIFTFVLLIF